MSFLLQSITLAKQSVLNSQTPNYCAIFFDFFFPNKLLFYSLYIPSQPPPSSPPNPTLTNLSLKQSLSTQSHQYQASPLLLWPNQAVLGGEKDPMAGYRDRDSPCSDCQGNHLKNKPSIRYECRESLGPVSLCSVVGGSVSVGHPWSWVVDSVSLMNLETKKQGIPAILFKPTWISYQLYILIFIEVYVYLLNCFFKTCFHQVVQAGINVNASETYLSVFSIKYFILKGLNFYFYVLGILQIFLKIQLYLLITSMLGAYSFWFGLIFCDVTVHACQF